MPGIALVVSFKTTPSGPIAGELITGAPAPRTAQQGPPQGLLPNPLVFRVHGPEARQPIKNDFKIFLLLKGMERQP